MTKKRINRNENPNYKAEYPSVLKTNPKLKMVTTNYTFDDEEYKDDSSNSNEQTVDSKTSEEAKISLDLIPTTVQSLKDHNNREYVTLNSIDEIEDLKHLKFPDFVKKENIR